MSYVDLKSLNKKEAVVDICKAAFLIISCIAVCGVILYFSFLQLVIYNI